VREIGRDRDAHTETERDRGIKKVRDTERDRHSEGQRNKEWQRLRETERNKEKEREEIETEE